MFNFKNDICLFFLSVLFTMGSWNLIAQESSLQPSFYFEPFELPGGELGNHVQTIAQDSFGFMWFGSQFGLHRWDGYQLKTYLNDVEDSTSIASDYVECIFVASDGALWLGHWGYGLDRFDYATETFQHYTHGLGNPDGMESNFVSEIIEDKEGNIWLGTQQGVLRLDVKTGKFKTIFT